MTTIFSDNEFRERLFALSEKFLRNYIDKVTHRSVELEKAAEQWRRLQPSLRVAVCLKLLDGHHASHDDPLVTMAVQTAIDLLDAASVQVP